ncbi:hypothetical protein GCU60_04830 [Blastococcus saxobsidens]|uniref:Uncharacterized protein n=1 Tax=Blastococcus saxobsidens TaxID=138336 RepID=A0A6L9W059_9ACTN|nr:hypothetical protein [Blastococcus saxobsidens]NEK85089.1 hypothetical protein [Blastococcus saxobsidens]
MPARPTGQGRPTTGDEAGLDDVAIAQQRLEQARADLQAAVARAHASGHTWSELGRVLGITRQAAFKRFGSPRDPRTGGTMRPATTTDDVAALTERVFRLVDAGDHDTLRTLMTEETAAVLTADLVLGTWARAVADTGNLMGCRGTGVELLDGTPVEAGETVLGSLVGHTVLECEAGHWLGRVALDPERRIVGLLVVPPDHGELPF